MRGITGERFVLRERVRRGVIGIVERDDRFLFIRRGAGVIKGGCWCFPGGHVEPGETPRRAIERELVEELGRGAVATQRVGSVRVLDGNYVLAIWRAILAVGELSIARDEVAEARWLTPTQIRRIHPSLPSTEDVLKLLGV